MYNNYMQGYQQNNVRFQHLPIITLINPIRCDKVSNIGKMDAQKSQEYEFNEKGLISSIKGNAKYTKNGIIIVTSLNRYFIPFSNVAGVANFNMYQNNHRKHSE